MQSWKRKKPAQNSIGFLGKEKKKGYNLFSSLSLLQHLVGTNDRPSHKTSFSGAL